MSAINGSVNRGQVVDAQYAASGSSNAGADNATSSRSKKLQKSGHLMRAKGITHQETQTEEPFAGLQQDLAELYEEARKAREAFSKVQADYKDFQDDLSKLRAEAQAIRALLDKSLEEVRQANKPNNCSAKKWPDAFIEANLQALIRKITPEGTQLGNQIFPAEDVETNRICSIARLGNCLIVTNAAIEACGRPPYLTAISEDVLFPAYKLGAASHTFFLVAYYTNQKAMTILLHLSCFLYVLGMTEIEPSQEKSLTMASHVLSIINQGDLAVRIFNIFLLTATCISLWRYCSYTISLYEDRPIMYLASLHTMAIVGETMAVHIYNKCANTGRGLCIF